MSKNLEIVAEILSDEVNKLEKLVNFQKENIIEYGELLKSAGNAQVSTKRLEEVIEFWNELFDKQKDQIKKLRSFQEIENKKHRLWTYAILLLVSLQLFFIITILIFKNI